MDTMLAAAPEPINRTESLDGHLAAIADLKSKITEASDRRQILLDRNTALAQDSEDAALKADEDRLAEIERELRANTAGIQRQDQIIDALGRAAGEHEQAAQRIRDTATLEQITAELDELLAGATVVDLAQRLREVIRAQARALVTLAEDVAVEQDRRDRATALEAERVVLAERAGVPYEPRQALGTTTTPPTDSGPKSLAAAAYRLRDGRLGEAAEVLGQHVGLLARHHRLDQLMED